MYSLLHRLQYFARGSQTYHAQLSASLKGKTAVELRDEQVYRYRTHTQTHSPVPLLQAKLRSVALKMTANINSLVRDFFRNPPSYSTHVQLSWGAKVSNLSTTTVHDHALSPPPRNLALLSGATYNGRGPVARMSLQLNESILQSNSSRLEIQRRLRRSETRFPITLPQKISLVRSSRMVGSSTTRIKVVVEVGVALDEVGVVSDEEGVEVVLDGDTLVRLNCFFSYY